MFQHVGHLKIKDTIRKNHSVKKDENKEELPSIRPELENAVG
jgi:hypothetical protein